MVPFQTTLRPLSRKGGAMTDEYARQPPISGWKFIEQLKAPLHVKTAWKRFSIKKNEADLKKGVSLEFAFPDPAGKLETAYADFRSFLAAGNVPVTGCYKIVTDVVPTSCFEEYIVDAGKNSCRVLAADTEGIRRALVFLEDSILRSGGPFLPFGKTRRKPFIKTRISRCFFGPIKRLPMNRDELMDDVNYYPDEYLNRLIHEGINGLWLSIEFRDLCPSRFFPGHGKDAQKRLEKLRQTVKQCARYGIKIYIYCNEPIGFGNAYFQLPVSSLEKNPYFAGHSESSEWESGGVWTRFCTSSKEGREYLEECTNFIFSNVPGLGGMICITLGEWPTNCYSYPHTFFNNNCPRCSKRKPWEVYHDTLLAMVRGIKKAAPGAEFISWLYTPTLTDDNSSSAEEKKEVIRQIAAHTPKDVVMQLNFESNGKVRQLGREFIAYDYWLAWPGPSDIFGDCAAGALKAGARGSAKIQAGCSHENAAIPFMPVPGSLYRKYHAMKELGVSSVMQCWYFGNYPGLMNKAAGELSFLPFPKTENEFLENLAKIDWPGNHKKVGRAWKYFMKGYSNFPIALSFTWFGPLHCSIVWPLHLFPVDQPIAPSWEFGFPDSGDRIGECICFAHSLGEIITLLSRMDANWSKGLEIIAGIKAQYSADPARQLDISLYKTIGLQIKSAKNVFSFYDCREQLPFRPRAEQMKILKTMESIVAREIANSGAMQELCRKDPRLGFHSEAEGYKFFPAKLDWRAGLLKGLLKRDFPEVRADIRDGKPLFPEYTWLSPRGKTYHCGKSSADAALVRFEKGIGSWKAWRQGNKLFFEVKWAPEHSENETINIDIEPRRLWPVIRFQSSVNGQKSYYNPSFQEAAGWNAETKKSGGGVVSFFSIPFKAIPRFNIRHPLRINIYQTDSLGTHAYLSGWIKHNPLKPRLLFGTHNSADLGWFFVG